MSDHSYTVSSSLPNNNRQHKIRAKDEATRELLEAACAGDLEYFLKQPSNNSQWKSDAHCTSGCTALHWAAGSNQVEVLKLLLGKTQKYAAGDDNKMPMFDSPDLPVTASRKSYGRTPLHYSCRNGCLEATQYLIEQAGADPHRCTKHGVTPFQLAVWQNRLEICHYLVEQCHVNPAKEVNDFACGAVHWLGIAPSERANFGATTDGRDLLPMAEWLASFEGIDFRQKQRQGHSALHKASWGGHLALVKYLHTEHGMMDDAPDHAGNYAASLADMANTARHDKIATFLRKECSTARMTSCAILGVPVTATEAEIRKAYLIKAKELHPDKCHNDFETADYKFQELQLAYRHLTEEKGHGNQSNPAHSLNLMLQVTSNEWNQENTTDDIEDTEDATSFKARLMAVLLEYGDKGMDLSNVKKKWFQVWGPDVPFPSQIKSQEHNNNNGKTKQPRKVPLSELLEQLAGDVIRLDRDEENGGLKVYSRNCSRNTVVLAAKEGKVTVG